MSAGVLNLEIEQGTTFRRRIYFYNKRVVTAILDYTSPLLVGSDSITFAPGGAGFVNEDDWVMIGSKVYKPILPTVEVPDVGPQPQPVDLGIGGTVELTTPIEEEFTEETIPTATVIVPMDLTGAEFNSQIRATANSPDIIATITSTLATNPLDGYFDLYISADDTGAIPTPDKTDYTKKAKYTCDGELVIGGDVQRSYNGTVMVSPQVTRLAGEP